LVINPPDVPEDYANKFHGAYRKLWTVRVDIARQLMGCGAIVLIIIGVLITIKKKKVQNKFSHLTKSMQRIADKSGSR
jgi:hypothetical protein